MYLGGGSMRTSRFVTLVLLAVAALSGAPLRAALADSIVPTGDTRIIVEPGGVDYVLAVFAMDYSYTPIANPQVNWQGPSSPPMATLELGNDPNLTEQGFSYVHLRQPTGNGTYQVTATFGASVVVF